MCYTARVFAVVSGVFKTRNPISMKRRNKRLRRETNIAFQVVTLLCPRLRTRCLHSSWSLSTYILEEKLSDVSRKRENHYRNSPLVFSHTDINTHSIGLLRISNILEESLSNFHNETKAAVWLTKQNKISIKVCYKFFIF